MITLILSCLSLIYVTYIYALWLSKEEVEYGDYAEPVSVIIPCFNEGGKELTLCVESILKAKGKKQVILVDNNSNKPETANAISKLMEKYPYQFKLLFEKRQGKRFAHSKGLEYAKYEIVCFVDSDTIIKDNALLELIKPFQNRKVGATAGNIEVINKNENILTRSIAAMFWTSFNIARKATSSLGYMQVIAGALGAYRKSLLMKLEKEYVTQTFLGRPCSISDDRFLTTRIQTRFKKEVHYVETAIGYTYMPGNVFKFWKTLERWRRGATREILLLWKEPFWNAKWLMFDAQFNLLFLSAMMVVKLRFLYELAIHFSIFQLGYTFLWFAILAVMYSSIMLVQNTRDFPYKIIWSIMYEFFFVFVSIHAWFNIRRQGAWSTR